MKQPIAMHCTQEQFESVRQKITFTIRSLSNFIQYPYITNHFRGLDIVSNISENEKHFNDRIVYEEWNEKIFLEACGIEVEKTFSITESQIKKLEETETIYEKDSLLHRLFPEAFQSEVKLEVGKWYKDTEYPGWKLFITNLDPSLKKVKCFGFCADGSWMENALEDNWDYYEFEKCIEMSEQEVFEALKNEAVKRGYKDGTWLKKSGINKINDQELKICGEFEYYPFSNILYCQEGNGYIFEKGHWAEIIETITLPEAEQQLGKKIIV